MFIISLTIENTPNILLNDFDIGRLGGGGVLV